MTLYHYKGQDYEVATDDPDVAKKKILAFLGDSSTSPKREKTAWYEDIGAGLRGVGESVSNVIGAAAAGLTTGERQEEIVGDVQKMRKEQQAREARLDRGEIGKVLQAVGAIPAYLNPVTAGLAIAGSAAETGMRLADDGADTGTALSGMAADAGLNLATMGAANKLQIAGRTANGMLQGGVNVAQEALLNHPVQNAIRENADLPRLPEMTPGDYGAAYIPGHVIGHMTAKGASKAQDADPSMDTVPPKTQADLDADFVTRTTARIESIAQQYIKKTELQEDLNRTGSMTEKQKKFYDILEEQKKILQEEHKKHSDILTKYGKETTEPLSEAEKIAQLDLDLSDNVQKSQLGLDTLPTVDDFHNMILEEQARLKNTEPTGEAFRNDVEVRTGIPSADGTGRLILGQNVDGKLYIDPALAKPVFDSLPPEAQQSVGSPRGLQLFAEIHEAVHNLVKQKDGEPLASYERRVNELIVQEWRAQGLHVGEPGTRKISRELLNKFDTLVKQRADAQEAGETEPVNKPPAIFDEIPPIGSLEKPHPMGGIGKKQGGAVLSPSQLVTAITNAAKKLRAGLDLNTIDVTHRRSPQELAEDPKVMSGKDISGVVGRNFFGFGQLVEGLKREAPIVWENFKLIKGVLAEEIELKRLLWAGNAQKLLPKGFGPFMTLKHYNDPTTLSQLIPKLTTADKVAVFEFMKRNADTLTRHTTADMSGLSDIQKKAVTYLEHMYDTVQRHTGTRRRNGYIHAFRPKGDFAVGLKTTLGDISHIEVFPSKKIADEWRIRRAKEGHNTTDIIDFKTPEGATIGESFGIVKDVVSSLFEKNSAHNSFTLGALDKAQQFIADKSTIGKHNVQREGHTGYAGTRLGKTRAENANEFFNSIEGYIGEVSSQWKKTLLTRNQTYFWENEFGRQLAEKFPNQKSLSDFLFDHASNRLEKFGIGEWVDNKKVELDNLFANSVSSVVGTAKKIPFFGKKISLDEKLYYPGVPVLDKTTGMLAQFFYISALTTRPAFWVGQLLSTPFAMRQFLKEGNTLDLIVSQGKGWGTIMSGGDAEFKAFIKDFVNTTDSTHPQFKNEINEFPIFDSKTNQSLNKLFEFTTGQTISGMADSVSRYFVIATAYHHYKEMGMSGTRLKANIQNLVDNTMVMYDRSHSSPMFSRLGSLGQQIAPLQKYGLAQLSNLIGDLKFVAQQKGGINKLRATAPAISTMLTTMIMAGSIGLPLLVEYELLRKGFIEVAKLVGWTDVEDYVPKSVYETMLTHDNVFQKFAQSMYETVGTSEEFAKDASTHGVISAATGFDIGSSLRFNPYVPGVEANHQSGLINSFPVIKSAIDLAAASLVHTKKFTGADTSLAEQRKADLQIQLFPGQRYLIDKHRYNSDTRKTVPGGNRFYGQVEQTEKEQTAQLLGTSTVSTAKSRVQAQIEQQKDKDRATMRQKTTDMLVDAIQTGDQKTKDRALDLAVKSEMTPKMLLESAMNAMRQRETDRETARVSGKKGYPKSRDQLLKFRESQAYE